MITYEPILCINMLRALIDILSSNKINDKLIVKIE